MTEPILQARGLVKRYGRVTAIDGADFDLLPGEVLAVVGDNGAGKSSLIKTLSGAVIPDEGEIKVDGQSWTARPYSSDVVIEQGTEIEVYEIDGAIAVVYPKHGQLP